MINIKIKALSPSLREKKRYLVYEIISENKILEFRLVNNAILEAGVRLIGEIGMAEAGVIVMKDKYEKKKGIIRLNHKYVHHLKAALSLITKINNEDVIFRSIGVSGILDKAEKKFLAS